MDAYTAQIISNITGYLTPCNLIVFTEAAMFISFIIWAEYRAYKQRKN